MKDKVSERVSEEKASELYCAYLEEKGIRAKGEPFYEFPILNIKVFKLIFNRAYRLTSSDNDRAIELYSSLLQALEKLLPNVKDSYYEAKIRFELSKCYSNKKMANEALGFYEAGSKILENGFGKTHCMYLDSLYTKITLSFDLPFPQEEID
jgi:hypothetical protein